MRSSVQNIQIPEEDEKKTKRKCPFKRKGVPSPKGPLLLSLLFFSPPIPISFPSLLPNQQPTAYRGKQQKEPKPTTATLSDMGTGWRRAFCTSVRRDPPDSSSHSSPSPSPRASSRLSLFGFHTSSSNPSTPRQQPPSPPDTSTPSLTCRTTTTSKPTPEPPKSCSPRSPSRFALLKNTLRLSRSSCGICLQSVKTLQGTAIYIAECSHTFHFPCISTHVRKHRALSCPVCAATWRQVPRLSLEADEDQHSNGGWRAAIERVRATKEQEKTCKVVPNSNSKAYNDDEPLLSPGGSRFNPIPEAEEEEFTRTSSSEIQVTVSTDVALLSSTRNHESYVIALKAKAVAPMGSSPFDPSRRAPVDLVMVIDVGGTIAAAKFDVLKKAMRIVISFLGAGDRLSIVAFSSASKRLLPLRRMSLQGQRAALRIADHLVRTDGTGAASEAIRKANRILEDRRERNAVAGVVLLSDAQQQRNHHRNLPRYPSSLSCWVSSTTSPGSTRYAHVEIPVASGDCELPENALASCVAGFLSVVAIDVRLEVSLPSGDITACYSHKGQPPVSGSTQSISLGDLYADEERELLMEVRTPTATSDSTTALVVKCCYGDPLSQELIFCNVLTPVLPIPAAASNHQPRHQRHQSAAGDSRSETLKNVYIATRAVSESRRLVELNELSTAVQLLTSARAILQRSASASASADENLKAVEAELAEVQRRREQRRRGATTAAVTVVDEAEALTPTSAWRAAERLAKVAMMRKSLNRRVSDLHGFEDARF